MPLGDPGAHYAESGGYPGGTGGPNGDPNIGPAGNASVFGGYSPGTNLPGPQPGMLGFGPYSPGGYNSSTFNRNYGLAQLGGVGQGGRSIADAIQRGIAILAASRRTGGRGTGGVSVDPAHVTSVVPTPRPKPTVRYVNGIPVPQPKPPVPDWFPRSWYETPEYEPLNSLRAPSATGLTRSVGGTNNTVDTSGWQNINTPGIARDIRDIQPGYSSPGGLAGGLANAMRGFQDGGMMEMGETAVVGEAGPELATAGPTGTQIMPMSPVNRIGPQMGPGGGGRFPQVDRLRGMNPQMLDYLLRRSQRPPGGDRPGIPQRPFRVGGDLRLRHFMNQANRAVQG